MLVEGKVAFHLTTAAGQWKSIPKGLADVSFCPSGWYEDSVFHVNGFGFPPTEPSSATRSVDQRGGDKTHSGSDATKHLLH